MFDVHSHTIQSQEGGFLLSIEGDVAVPGGQSYDVLKYQQVPENFYVIPYVTVNAHYKDEPAIYIHARREGFSPSFVLGLLEENRSNLVVLDTFNRFKWSIHDYYTIVTSFPEKTFLLAHGGGYEISDFVQLVRYTKNTYIDFSATHSIFSCIQPRNSLEALIDGYIQHAVKEARIKSRILFGSDNPEFSQSESIEYYSKIDKNIIEKFDQNFLKLVDKVF